MDDVTKSNDEFLLAARGYIDSVTGQDTVCVGINPHVPSKSSSRLTTSTMSSQRKLEFVVALLEREEAEKQEQAALRLAKQKHEIAMRKKELEIQMQLDQIAIQELEEDYRQRVAAAKLTEAELMNNTSLFSHHSSKLNLLKDRGSIRSKNRVEDWVKRFPGGKTKTGSSEPNSARPESAKNPPSRSRTCQL